MKEVLGLNTSRSENPKYEWKIYVCGVRSEVEISGIEFMYEKVCLRKARREIGCVRMRASVRSEYGQVVRM